MTKPLARGGEDTVAVTAEINSSLEKRVSSIEVRTKSITKQLEVAQNPSFIYDIFDRSSGIPAQLPLNKLYSIISTIAPDSSGILQVYGSNRYNQTSMCFITVRKGSLDVEFEWEQTGPYSTFTVWDPEDFTYEGNEYTTYTAVVTTKDSIDTVICKSKDTGITLLKFILLRS